MTDRPVPVDRSGVGQKPRRRYGGTGSDGVIEELWAPVRPGRTAQDRAFLPDSLELLEAPASRFRIGVLYTLCGLVAAALIASWFCHLDVYAEANGIVQAAGHTKVVQPRESGKVVAIEVHDGDHVAAGQVLVRLDPTDAEANWTVARDTLDTARAEIVRRQAAIAAAGQDPIDTAPNPTWPADLPAPMRQREDQSLRSDLASVAAALASLRSQKTATEAQRDKYRANLVPLQALIDLGGEAFGMGSNMLKEGWNSKLQVLAMEQQVDTAKLQWTESKGLLAQAEASIAVIDTAMVETRQNFINSNIQALVAAEQSRDQAVQTLAKAKSTLDDMTLRAPIAGVVAASAVTSLGQVVGTGAQVLQIVPQGASLEIQCYVLNTDAGFVRAGQSATIKVDSFPYTRYGTILGRVVRIARDAMSGQEALQAQKNSATAPTAGSSSSLTSPAQATSDLVFPVTVAPTTTTIDVGGRAMPIEAGMTVVVEIKTQSRRAIDYILSPIQAALGTRQE